MGFRRLAVDSRQLGVDDHGPPGAPVVVLLHSAPGSCRFDPDPAVTAQAGVRLVTIDRPGYGASTTYPPDVLPTVAGLAGDMAAALDQLGVSRAGVVGWSAGGRVAAALAAARPALVARLAMVATPAPDEHVPWLEPGYRELTATLRQNPSGARAIIEAALAPVAQAVDEGPLDMVAGGPVDDPELAARVSDMVKAAFAQGAAGLATDITADQIAPWGFDPAGIVTPTNLFYGMADTIAGPPHGEWWASVIPGSTLTVVEDGTHLVVATAWRAILEAVSVSP